MIKNLLLLLVAMLEGAGRDEGYNQLHLLHCSSISDTCCPRVLHFLQVYLHAGMHGYLFKAGCRLTLPAKRSRNPVLVFMSQLWCCSFPEKEVLAMNHNGTYIRLKIQSPLTAIFIATLLSRICSAFYSYEMRHDCKDRIISPGTQNKIALDFKSLPMVSTK